MKNTKKKLRTGPNGVLSGERITVRKLWRDRGVFFFFTEIRDRPFAGRTRSKTVL